MFLALFMALPACGDGAGDGGEDGGPGGKADDVDTGGELFCSLEEGETRSIAQFVSDDTVQMRCRGPGGKFVETDCCAAEIDEFTFATGCPVQSKFNTAAGSAKRCVEDEPDISENVDGDLIVPTVCCATLCDPDAGWDDAETMTACRASNGQFHPQVCCMMNDAARCGDAAFDASPDVNGLRHCRSQSGDFAGQFAPAACCVDACFGILESGEDVPIECLLPLDEECSGAELDTGGLCRSGDGRFAKAACCAGFDGLQIEQSDACYEAELLGRDLMAEGCA